MDTATITRRSRIGYAVNTQPEQRVTDRGETYLTIPRPTEPQMTGTPRQILAELESNRQRLGSAERANAFFVGGRRIVAAVIDGQMAPPFAALVELLTPVCRADAVTVQLG